MRIALGWLVGTTVFAAEMVVADRWFWGQCNGLPTTRYGEVWICANAFTVRIAIAAAAGIASGLLARRLALVLGLLTGLAGIAAVSLAYRPMIAFNQAQGLLNGVVYFVLPAMLAAALAAMALRKKPF